MKVRLPTVLEIEIPNGHPHPRAEAGRRLDSFRESVLPAQNYGITIHQPSGLAPALAAAEAALDGDSNDAEHDALLRLLEVLESEWQAQDD
jgi:hypothetical protein